MWLAGGCCISRRERRFDAWEVLSRAEYEIIDRYTGLGWLEMQHMSSVFFFVNAQSFFALVELYGATEQTGAVKISTKLHILVHTCMMYVHTYIHSTYLLAGSLQLGRASLGPLNLPWEKWRLHEEKAVPCLSRE